MAVSGSLKVTVWLILCLIWGSTWIFIKIGLEDLPPIVFAAARFILASIIIFAIIAVKKIELPRNKADWLASEPV